MGCGSGEVRGGKVTVNTSSYLKVKQKLLFCRTKQRLYSLEGNFLDGSCESLGGRKGLPDEISIRTILKNLFEKRDSPPPLDSAFRTFIGLEVC